MYIIQYIWCFILLPNWSPMKSLFTFVSDVIVRLINAGLWRWKGTTCKNKYKLILYSQNMLNIVYITQFFWIFSKIYCISEYQTSKEGFFIPMLYFSSTLQWGHLNLLTSHYSACQWCTRLPKRLEVNFIVRNGARYIFRTSSALLYNLHMLAV